MTSLNDASSFQYQDGELHAEDLPVDAIADAVKTPFYLYSHATLTANYRRVCEAFSAVDHLVCYSVKALSNLAILRCF